MQKKVAITLSVSMTEHYVRVKKSRLRCRIRAITRFTQAETAEDNFPAKARSGNESSFLFELENVIQSRKENPSENSYTSKLFAKGIGPVLVLQASGGVKREELIKIDTAPIGAGTGPLGSP